MEKNNKSFYQNQKISSLLAQSSLLLLLLHFVLEYLLSVYMEHKKNKQWIILDKYFINSRECDWVPQRKEWLELNDLNSLN